MPADDHPTDVWRICSEDSDALAFVNADGRKKREYESAKNTILADPLNASKDWKRHRLTKPKWKALGRVHRFKVNSGWRFIYLVDQEAKCIDVLHAGPHDEINTLAYS